MRRDDDRNFQADTYTYSLAVGNVGYVQLTGQSTISVGQLGVWRGRRFCGDSVEGEGKTAGADAVV